MASKRYVVMGAGEVGYHLAESLSREGHSVVVIEPDPGARERVAQSLDVSVVAGNGAHLPVLEAAGAQRADLFMAVSSSDEANLTASALARHLGAQRTVVRVGIAEEVTTYRRHYEDVFGVDHLISTQLLATTQILNHILGHNTLAVEYLAKGKVQLRKVQLDKRSPLTRKSLGLQKMPPGSLVVGFYRGEDLLIPSGEDQAQPGDVALILYKTEVLAQLERLFGSRRRSLGYVVIGGGGATALTVANALVGRARKVKIIEQSRPRAEELAALLPEYEIVCGDVTELSLLRSERVEGAHAFVALTGNDEKNLMACLLAQELGISKVVALVQRSETSLLWKKLGTIDVVSPRRIAYQRIQEYIQQDYSGQVVSLAAGKVQVIERRLEPASPAAGVTLAEMSPPRGLIIGAVARKDRVRGGERVFVPQGKDRLEAGDRVILFVAEEEIPTVRLLFPGATPGRRGQRSR